MDTITKRENCLDDLKLAKQVMMCRCVFWPRDTKRTKSSDGRLLATTTTTTTMKMENKKTSILRVGTTCACARRPPNIAARTFNAWLVTVLRRVSRPRLFFVTNRDSANAIASIYFSFQNFELN